MPTLDAMVEETVGHLRAFSADQSQKTSLTTTMSTVDLTFMAADPDRINGGLVEIDEELVEVSEVDGLSGLVTIYPWARAQQGSVAATHAIGARITVAPRWPYARVKQAINSTLKSLWPDLFAVVVDESNTTSPTTVTYPLPAACRRILDIRWNSPGTPVYWAGVRGWRLDLAADPATYPTGVAVDVPEAMWPGRTLKVTYAAEPTAMTSGSQDFATTTGLPDSVSELVVIGAAADLVVTSDLARTQSFTLEHSARLDTQTSGAAVAAARYLQQLFQVRLAAERDRLQGRYPIRVRRTWL